MIEFASGACSKFLMELRDLSIRSSFKATKALHRLQKLDPRAAQQVLNSFEASKAAMMLRFQQGTSFYEKFPWCLPKLLCYIVCLPDARSDALRQSRGLANHLVNMHQAGTLERGTFADKIFLQPHLVEALQQWASGQDATMNADLFKKVLEYGVCLVPMQRLEARHHLVHQKAQPARSGSVAYISANLRRLLNQDVKQPAFRKGLENFLSRFNELVSEPWTTRAELARLTSGHNLSIMFANMDMEEAMIAAAAPQPRSRIANALLYQEHLKLCLMPGGYYALPTSVTQSATTYCICRVIDPRPSGKKYMERAVQWSDDLWNDHVGILLLGTHVVTQDTVDLEADAGSQTAPLPLPPSFSHDALLGSVERLSIDIFFKYDFDNIYSLEHVTYTTRLSMDAIYNAMDEDCLLETTDAELLRHSFKVPLC